MMSSSIQQGARRGSLIVFEGCDRVGKSTQCKLLATKLQSLGISTKLLHFPDRSTPIGQMIDKYLTNKSEMSDHSIHLLFSANRWELKKCIYDNLLAGTTLIIDRYAYSGVAFTAAKKIASLEWCKGPDRSLPLPDAVFYLHLPSDSAQERPNFGNERYEKKAFQEEVSKIYEQLKEDNWYCINASNTIENISECILNDAMKIVHSVQDKPIGQLWI